jgi:hypothetical protein
MLLRSTLLVSALAATLLCFACNKPSDETIVTDIKARLYSEPLLKSSPLDVTAKDGTVTLSGQVPDDAARLAAQHIASTTPGVRTVVDQTIMAPALQAAVPTPVRVPAPPKRPAKQPAKAATPATAPAPAPSETATTAVPASDPGPLNGAAKDKVADTRPVAPTPPPPPPPPQPVIVTIPDGTIVTVRTIDSVDSKVNHAGQLFRASLDAPIVVGDQVVVPRGLNVYMKLTDASSAGKFKGRSELTVSLDSFTYQGKTYQVASSDVQEQGSSRGKRSAAVIGGGAALGALIGGLAGGGKGAAIGAGVGAGSGTAVQALTHGEQVKIPSETRLDFTLKDPVTVTYLPKKSSTHPHPAPPAEANPPDDNAQPDNSQPAPAPASNDRPPQQ